MPLNLAAPLTWTALPPTQAAALKNLQGNILKGHGRSHTVNVFLRFAAGDAAAVRLWLRSVKVSDAFQQLKDADAVRAARQAGKKPPKTSPFVALFLSATGYQKLGVAPGATPPDAKFRSGLKSRQSALQDPVLTQWDKAFQGDVDLMLLVGDVKASAATAATKALLASRPTGLVEIARETGVAYRNANGDGLEHFGYVDGRSQPLLIEEDVAREANESTGVGQWDPRFPLDAALVHEPGGDPDAFGSYFVFRKLEQNVKAFRALERKLARALSLSGPDADLAGAMAVGRFKDGTPLILQNGPGMHHPVTNNFGFSEDPKGHKCPLHAHIRKTNPRGDSERLGGGATLAAERTHLMPRRGITYGKRRLAKSGGFAESDQPTRGVGLLFMAYNADIGRQFEFTQSSWANNAHFVDPSTGIDPVIGQASGPIAPQAWPESWGGTTRAGFSFHSATVMRGGEYFFAPSLSFLKSL